MVVELIICLLATMCFGVIFHVPNKALFLGALMGCLSWFIYRTLPDFNISVIFATALAALISASLAHLFAKRFRIPATTFTIPAIIPLVPGSRAYFTMLAFVEKDYLLGLELGIETMLQAGAIAAGLMFALSIFSFRKGGIGHRYESSR